MRFEISQEIFRDFGQVSFGAVMASGCANVCQNEILEAVSQKALCRAKELLANSSSLEGLNPVCTWRSLYSKMGASSSKKSSVESLYETVYTTGCLPSIIPLVDLYNSVSCFFGLPMAGYNRSNIKGDLVYLRRANKGENFVPLGLRQVEKTRNGEVVYSDSDKVMCRYWNNRDSDLTKLGSNTDSVIFIIDGAPNVGRELILEAFGLLEETLRGFSAIVHGHVIVDFTEPSKEIKE